MKKRSWMVLTSGALVGSHSCSTNALSKNTRPGPHCFDKQMDTLGLAEGQRQWEEIVSDSDNNLASPRASHPDESSRLSRSPCVCK